MGGRVAALEAALALQHDAGDRVSVAILAPESQFTYRPLAVTEPFRVGEVRTFPIAAIEASGATVRRGALGGVDADGHVVRTDGGEELPYDVLLLALGAQPVEAVPGALTFRGRVTSRPLG